MATAVHLYVRCQPRMETPMERRRGGKLDHYHAGQNDYRYRSEIKSKTIGLYQITDVGKDVYGRCIDGYVFCART